MHLQRPHFSTFFVVSRSNIHDQAPFPPFSLATHLERLPSKLWLKFNSGREARNLKSNPLDISPCRLFRGRCCVQRARDCTPPGPIGVVASGHSAALSQYTHDELRCHYRCSISQDTSIDALGTCLFSDCTAIVDEALGVRDMAHTDLRRTKD